jgi:hypothetical protein
MKARTRDEVRDTVDAFSVAINLGQICLFRVSDSFLQVRPSHDIQNLGKYKRGVE